MKASDRETNGRFATGNAGGPGRPRRAVQREYLATISDAVPLDVWREIVARVVEDARGGDAKARDWLSKFLLGASVSETPLLDLAADEQRGRTCDKVVAARAKKRDNHDFEADLAAATLPTLRL